MARQDRAGAGGARSNLYDDITNKIIGELEDGRLPWVQPWGSAAAKAPLAMPRNAATSRQYSSVYSQKSLLEDLTFSFCVIILKGTLVRPGKQ